MGQANAVGPTLIDGGFSSLQSGFGGCCYLWWVADVTVRYRFAGT